MPLIMNGELENDGDEEIVLEPGETIPAHMTVSGNTISVSQREEDE